MVGRCRRDDADEQRHEQLAGQDAKGDEIDDGNPAERLRVVAVVQAFQCHGVKASATRIEPLVTPKLIRIHHIRPSIHRRNSKECQKSHLQVPKMRCEIKTKQKLVNYKIFLSQFAVFIFQGEIEGRQI